MGAWQHDASGSVAPWPHGRCGRAGRAMCAFSMARVYVASGALSLNAMFCLGCFDLEVLRVSRERFLINTVG